MLSRIIGSLMLATTLSASAAVIPPSAPAYEVRLEKTWIPMKDGVRLSATLYHPATRRSGERFPALLEYLPYRKDDDEAVRDYGTHTYFARRGYVGARVDIRGFGTSEGTPPDREYSAQEQQDGEEVIAWLARQPWSNGKVGMLGISWGGFNSIQMALRKPACAQSHTRGCRHRRAVQRRRALHGRQCCTSMSSNSAWIWTKGALEVRISARGIGDRTADGLATLVAQLHEAPAGRRVLARASAADRDVQIPRF